MSKPMTSSARIVIGLAVWLIAGLSLYFSLQRQFFTPGAGGRRIAADLWKYATAPRRAIKLRLDANWPLAAGDPIYRVEGPGAIEQVGEIRRVYPRSSQADGGTAGPVAEALLYPSAPVTGDRSYLTYYNTPQSLSWVMETMLPPEKRIRIAEEILSAYEAHHREILDALRPIVVGGLFDAMEVVEEDLISALSRRRKELESLGSRYQDHVVEQDVVPLVRQEIWPIVSRHVQPLANEIGEELFQRASLWRFGWRFLYDKSFLPEKNLMQDEWNRFVRDEGLPVLDRHSSDIVAVQRRILEEVAQNQQVRDAVRRNLARVIDDPEFQAIVWQVFREVMVDNPRLRARLEQRWKTVEAREAVELAADYVEPSVRRIGDLMFGTRDEGIAPEFAQVLRNQILDKDCRWLVLEVSPDSVPHSGPAASQCLPVHWGGYPDVNPFAVQLQRVR